MNTCATCIHSYQDPILALMCSFYNCVCTEQTGTYCPDYSRATGSDDESPAHRVWYEKCDSQGRGD